MPNFLYEDNILAQRQDFLIAGVDEAGRGPWFGPVIASSVIFLNRDVNKYLLENLNDSKKISKNKHQILYDLLREEEKKKNIVIGVGEASNQEIDDLNILNATFLSMQRSIENLIYKPNYALIDGNRTPKNFICDCQCIIKGDSISYSISAASIIAKVTRDNILKEYAQKYPMYGFESNSGYGTKKHIEAINKYGITPLHRKSYAPIKKIIENTLRTWLVKF